MELMIQGKPYTTLTEMSAERKAQMKRELRYIWPHFLARECPPQFGAPAEWEQHFYHLAIETDRICFVLACMLAPRDTPWSREVYLETEQAIGTVSDRMEKERFFEVAPSLVARFFLDQADELEELKLPPKMHRSTLPAASPPSSDARKW